MTPFNYKFLASTAYLNSCFLSQRRLIGDKGLCAYFLYSIKDNGLRFIYKFELK